MCFRPAEASTGLQPIECAHCGGTIFPVDDIFPKFCPYCEEPLEAVQNSVTPAAPQAPGAPQAPSAPKAPAMPSAPKTPPAPSVPKPPTSV